MTMLGSCQQLWGGGGFEIGGTVKYVGELRGGGAKHVKVHRWEAKCF